MGNVSEAAKTKFLEPLKSGDVTTVYNNFHPELRAKFELPVLAQFVRAITDDIGPFDRVDAMNIEKSVGWSSSSGKSKAQGGNLIHERGNLEYSVTFDANEQIVSFRLYSPQMRPVWLRQIETATYVERSLRVINAFYQRNEQGVTTELHQNLRKVVPSARLQAMMDHEINRDELGAFISVAPNNIPEVQETIFDETDQESKLILNFRIERENAVASGTIKWVFQSMVGTIIAFEFGKSVIEMKKVPVEGDGKKLGVDALQAVVDKDANKFVGLMMKTLKDKTDPAVLAFLFNRNFPGNPKESVSDSLAKATETFEENSGFKMVGVTGLLPYEGFNMKYKLVFLNGKIYEFDVAPDSTDHIKEDLDSVAKIIQDKSKLFIVKLIEMSKITESRALISPAVLQQKLHDLDKTQTHIREKIKPKNVSEVTFDIQVTTSKDPVWKVPVKFAFGKDSFSGWINWELNPLQGAYIIDWEIKSDAVIEWEKYNAIRAPLWVALNKHGLRVFFEKATNLAAADSNGFSDPYVVLSLHSQVDKRTAKAKSKVIKMNLNPVWNEMLVLVPTATKQGVVFNASDIIKVEVWDKDKIFDDFLGQFHFTISEILTMVVEKGEVIMPIALKDKKDGNKAQGEVYMKFVFTSE